MVETGLSYWKNKTILITGGRGFLGTHIVNKLLIEKKVEKAQIMIPRSRELDLRQMENCVKAVKNKDIVIKTYLYEKAFKALLAGKSDEHDNIIFKAINEVSKEVDVIVLAQASLERLLQKIDKKGKKVNVLSSPRIAVDNLKKNIKNIINGQ